MAARRPSGNGTGNGTALASRLGCLLLRGQELGLGQGGWGWFSFSLSPRAALEGTWMGLMLFMGNLMVFSPMKTGCSTSPASHSLPSEAREAGPQRGSKEKAGKIPPPRLK